MGFNLDNGFALRRAMKSTSLGPFSHVGPLRDLGFSPRYLDARFPPPSIKPKTIREDEILASARVFFERYGRLPTANDTHDVQVPRMHPSETWSAIDQAGRNGCRGLDSDRSLYSILEPLRHELIEAGHLRANTKLRGDLTEEAIIESARKFFEIYKRLPTMHDGRQIEVPGMHKDESWKTINNAGTSGHRGLDRRRTLSIVLEPLRKELVEESLLVANSQIKGDLTEEAVRKSAALYFNLYGRLPTGCDDSNEPVPGMHRDETWRAINTAARLGLRGLVATRGLAEILTPLRAKLIASNKIKARPADKGNLCEEDILASARKFFEIYSRLPIAADSEGVQVPGMHNDETWNAINSAGQNGYRSLSKGRTLAVVLEPLRQELIKQGLIRPDSREKGDLTEEDIIASARIFFGKYNRLPSRQDNKIGEVFTCHAEETWTAIDSAGTSGCRGLVKGRVLSEILLPLRLELVGKGLIKANSKIKGQLSEDALIESAKKFYELYGRLPNSADGKGTPVPGFHKDEIWKSINSCGRKGHRGLKSGRTLAKILAPLRAQLVLSLSKNERPRIFNKNRSRKYANRSYSASSSIDTDHKPLTTFAKGEAFEQVAGLLLSTLYPNEVVIPQYCLKVDAENAYFGMRADYKVGNEIYEIKWGKASDNIRDTFNRHVTQIGNADNYHLLLLEPNSDVALPYKLFKYEAAKSPIKDALEILVRYIRELVEKDAGDDLSILRNYLYGLVMKSNQMKDSQRLEFITTELRSLFDAKQRTAFMKEHLYALYSPLEAYCEYNGKLWRDTIDVRELDYEKPGQYQLRHNLNDLSFNNEIDRNIAVCLEMTKDCFRVNDLLNVDDSYRQDDPVFLLPRGIKLASRSSGQQADYIIDSVDELPEIFEYDKADFDFAKEFIASY